MLNSENICLRGMGRALAAVAIATWLVSAAAAFAGTAPGLVCQAAKEKTSGRYAKCVAGILAKSVKLGQTLDATKCNAKLESGFTKAETKGLDACPTTDDSAATAATIDGCIGGVTTGILGGTPPPGIGGASARCDSRKTKLTGRYLDCLLRAQAKATKWSVFVDPNDTSKCADKLSALVAKSNAGDAQSPCSMIGDEAIIQAGLDVCPLDFSKGVTTPQTKVFQMSCDAGVAVLPIPVELTVTPGGAFVEGIPQTAETQVVVTIDETLVDTIIGLGANSIQLDDATGITEVTGASGGPAVNVVPGTPFLIDLTIDTDVPPNGLPGPVVVVTDVPVASLTVDVGATSVDFELDDVAVDLSMIPVLGTLSLACVPDTMAGNTPISFPVQ